MAKKRRFARLRRYSPRRRYRAFRRGKAPISLLTAVPVAMKGLVEPVLGGNGYIGAVQMWKNTNNPQDALMEFGNILSLNFSGYDMKANSWNFEKPLATYATILAGYAGSKLADKIGVNRQMKKIPMIGKYVKL